MPWAFLAGGPAVMAWLDQINKERAVQPASIDPDPLKHMTVEHVFEGGYYIKKCMLPPGIRFDQHRHTFDHQSKLISGRALVEVDGVSIEYTGPVELTIKARKVHSVTPLTPCEWHCIHETDKTDADDIDEEFIEKA
jgi:hypothetical protein